MEPQKRGWEKIAYWSTGTFGYVVPMAMTEGGWVPRDRPGTGPNTDIRMPHDTPRMVAKKMLQMYDAPSPFFALCPWLLADDAMVSGGYVGWPFDAWVGWAYADKYGPEKPVVVALTSVPPKEMLRGHRAEPLVIDVDSDTRDWAWIDQAYGAGYRRGNDKILLLEVHEYEGPATLEAQVVDPDGLPVEGVAFYYSYPGAPEIPPLPEPDPPGELYPEWCTRAICGITGPDGRISFAAAEPAAARGASQGAIWPKGGGDILDRVGLLEGTRNRHLNGLWLWQQEGTPEMPEPPNGDDEPPPPSWHMVVEYRPGSRIIAGRLPNEGVSVSIADPWGNLSTVISGSKPEYGSGGFEVLAPHLVEYTVSFLGQTFRVQMRDETAILTFTETPPEPLPEPPPEPPPEPLPPDRWAQVNAKLDRIIELIQALPKK